VTGSAVGVTVAHDPDKYSSGAAVFVVESVQK
jgi:hypothetical protein